jgi:hypothetical protein
MYNMIFQKLFLPDEAFHSRVTDLVTGFNAVAANKKLSLSEKVTELGRILQALTVLAVNEGKLAVNEDMFDSCMLRIDFLRDLIDAPGYSASPGMIAEGMLTRRDGISTLWEPLIKVREDSAEKIRKLYEGLEIAEARRRAKGPLLTTPHGLTYRLPTEEEGEARTGSASLVVVFNPKRTDVVHKVMADHPAEVIQLAAARATRGQRKNAL